MRQLISFQEGELDHDQMCCAFVYQKEIWGFSIPVKFRGRCWYLLSFGLVLCFWFGFKFLIFFSIGLFGVFFHTAPGTSCGYLEVLNTVLNKCGTAPKWVFFLSQGGFIVCFLWQFLITKTLTLLQCACGINSSQQGKKKDTSKFILNSRGIPYCMQMEISEHRGTDCNPQNAQLRDTSLLSKLFANKSYF